MTLPNVTIENANIIFRNFEGKADQYNPPGQRNFAVRLDLDVAQAMQDDGWNVKSMKAREGEEDAEPRMYLPVGIRYDILPPRVVMITSRGRNDIGEDLIQTLDWVEIATADLIVRPYEWSMPGGKGGIKAYLKSLFLTVREDELDLKYADVPQAGVPHQMPEAHE